MDNHLTVHRGGFIMKLRIVAFPDAAYRSSVTSTWGGFYILGAAHKNTVILSVFAIP